jgi:glucokinase
MNDEKYILAVDIGASKTKLGIFAAGGLSLSPVKEDVLVTGNFSAAAEMINSFLDQGSFDIDLACIGVPGPVIDGRSTTTNLPWFIDSAALAEDISIRAVKLVNDLEAMAAAVPLLPASDLYVLNKGVKRDKMNMAVLSPGTGLGEAYLCWDDVSHSFISHASEGGHCDFAPSTPLELDLLAYLQDEIGHVSYELVCSGIGIVNIYKFLEESNREAKPGWLVKRFEDEVDPSRVIIDAALAKEKSYYLCRRTLEMFVAILGAEAGNLALKTMALGGVYIGGGIPPRITDLLDSRAFLKTFLNKGRVSALLDDIPVQVVMNLNAPMIGAASIARGMI